MYELARQYAHALFELAESKQLQPHELHERFVGLLRARDHLALLPQIVREIELLRDRMKDVKPTLGVAKREDVETFQDRINAVLDTLKLDRDAFTTEVRHDLIGGFTLTTDRHRYDASYKNALINLYKELTA